MKNIWKSKVIWTAILQGIVGVVIVLQTSLPELGWIAMAKSILDVLLRILTTQPVGMRK